MEQRTVQMLESLDGLMDCAMNALKSIDKHDLLLDKEECELVKKLMLFLRPFKDLTDFVSDAKNSVGSILLIKTKIMQLCASKADDIAEIKSLKKAISANIEKRFKLSRTAKLAAMLDPNMHGVFEKDGALAFLCS
jgi:hypothetical protein